LGVHNLQTQEGSPPVCSESLKEWAPAKTGYVCNSMAGAC
jgi:hypothetical protein